MNNNSTIPPRTYKVNDLVKNIALCAMDIAGEDKPEPEIVNPILAFCQIAVSLPMQWFSQDERMMIFVLIDSLYAEGFQAFVDDIKTGDISFYNKMIGETGMQDHPHSDINVVVAKMMAMHDKEFGA